VKQFFSVSKILPSQKTLLEQGAFFEICLTKSNPALTSRH